jgi:hypothetical protein
MIDVVTGSELANRTVRNYMRHDGSYLEAIEHARSIVAQCIADDAVKGAPYWAPWVDEYLALTLTRDRALACYLQEVAALSAERDARRADAELEFQRS